ncbi:MAG: hypothetical protein DMF89_17825 [Acidobacteria bacterium]|nr:MAG: hypothetical protein DMF90_29350 [Acidobacteriota bacterium]PYR47768.1 MAG: hypothetical protein DMF89_17825 [Acidobacteriota bacterium]
MEGEAPVRVAQLMREIEEDARRDRRKQLLAHGGPHEYEDPEVYAIVDGILRRAVEALDRPASLFPEVLEDENQWRLELPLRYSSHRPVVGPVLLFIKRRMLLPMFRWLYEYSLENFRRQQYVNRLLFACVEELAIENARLRKMMARPASQGAAPASGQPAPRP